MRHCPALFIAAPASGQGKTTVTAALARYHSDRGREVRIFKTGPDFVDPMVLQRACGQPVYQLDLWMGGEDHCRQLLYDAAATADLILIEGVMGLFDGDCSSADLAIQFDIPVVAVIDASAMAQTYGALAHGLATYRPGLPFAGVFANRVAGESHWQMLAESLPEQLNSFGWLARDPLLSLPERHLGLVQATEIEDIDTRISRAAAGLTSIAEGLPPPVSFTTSSTQTPPPQILDGITIAIASDDAFAFLYPANVDILRSYGAELIFFSPLVDAVLPDADALYLPGGYPELHLDQLAANQSLKQMVRIHHRAGKPIVAECGGMLYLLDSLAGIDGQPAPMAGLLPGSAQLESRLVNLGMQVAPLPEGEIRGHTFHHSLMECSAQPIGSTKPARHHGRSESIYRDKRLTASYLHLYFPSNPLASAQCFLP